MMPRRLTVACWMMAALVSGALVSALVSDALAAGDRAPDSNRREARTRRGPVSATVRVSPAASRIGDSITVTIEVVAAPGIELLMPSFGESLERFTIVDFVPRESVDAAGNTVSMQTYRLQTDGSGKHTIPPVIIEFVDRRPGQRPAPEDEDAFELLTEPVDFEVESVIPSDATGKLRPALGALAKPPAGSSRASLLTGAGVLVALIAAAWWWIIRRRSRGIETRNAYEIARTKLDALRARPRPAVGDRVAMDAFFVAISDIVRRYVEGRFGLHAPELTTEEFLDAAAVSPDLTTVRQAFLREFLGRADQVKFAGYSPAAADVDDTLNAVTQFLDDTHARGDLAPEAARTPHEAPARA